MISRAIRSLLTNPYAPAALVAAGVLLLGAAPVAAKFDSNTFGSMRARDIGPAVMGGRIASLDAVNDDGRLTVWIGAATGGVWKSIDAGTTFRPVFDKYTQSIGAVRIDPSDAEIVWVGTGEPWTRNSVSIGTGVYRTTDGGDNWEFLGLADTERISKILVHPDDGETAWVCAVGHLWDSNEERGLFKTTDAGKTWDKVLYVDADTGCADVAMDPQEPDVMYASMWQFRRYPWSFDSGGPGSGLYKSSDGGETWREVTRGLPEGELGRIAIGVAPSRPNVVYATVESENTAMYRSDDLGESWRRTGTSGSVEARPFYFSLVVVDPHDHRRVYKPAQSLGVSEDGGETFTSVGNSTHSDHHAFWINPENTRHLLLGTDGGLYISYDRGVTWNFKQSLPLSQFYQVSFDMDRPYNVYGGLQDNGTWMGPSAAIGGVQNKHWTNIGFGDGFHAYVDPLDPDLVYTEWQGGRMQRMRRSTGETKNIQPLPERGDPKYRFNWNAAMHLSRKTQGTVYAGAQFLLRSRDRGDTWEKISPDLTTNDPEKQRQMESGGLTIDNSTAENHCTIYTISASPLDDQVIWVGTDDGNVQVTVDGGANWTNTTPNVPDVPLHTWVTEAEASPHDRATAFVTFDGHRTGDMTPYLYKTTDFGKTWTSLASEDIEGYALVVRQDLVNPDLLFLGTEFGLYISIDGGASWARFKENLPKVGVRDLRIHPRDHDLIVGTHGRGIFIIDDITPMRALNADLLEQDVVLLPSRPGVMTIPAGLQQFSGDDEYVGGNPDTAAQIVYYLKKRHMFGDLKVEVYDGDGTLITTLPAGKRRGINRVSWPMRRKPPKVPPAASLVPEIFSFFGPQAAAGDYPIKLIKAKTTLDGGVSIVMDPRADYTAEEMQLQDRTVARLYGMLEDLAFVVDRANDLRDQARERASGLKKSDRVARDANALADRLETLRKSLVATRKGGFIAGEEQLRERLTSLYGAVNGYEGAPTNSQLDYTEVLADEIDAAKERFDEITSGLAALNRQIERKKLAPLTMMTREAWEAQ